MIEKKNIDRVFQENLKDLEIQPRKRVWNGIAQDLANSSDSRSMPLWRRFGVAASLSLLFASAAFFYLNVIDQTPVVNQQVSQEQPAQEINAEQPRTPIDPQVTKANVALANNQEKVEELRKAGEPIFVKKPANQVIVTTNSIASVYTNIEDKYVVDEDVFLEEMSATESITDRIASIPTKEKEIEFTDKKWSVGPTVAPVFYNSLQSGSPLNSELSDNSKTSDNSLSVGVRVNYQLSQKLFIQSGINRVDLAYNTNDVNAFITSSKNGYNNINTSKPGVYLTPGQNATSSVKDLNRPGVSGDINQFMQYYELPIEMKYSLYDRKLGLNLVGGFSTMILSDNSVSFVSNDGITDLGGANNLNSLNFSGNVGVDLDYKISKSWYLNVAPMFKYQFNTYSGNSGDFRPYYFGLYSGLNYKF